MVRNNNTDKRLITFELAALFIFALVLIGHLSVTRFAEGYYGHFGVTLSEINFTPQIYDYVNIVLPALIGASVVVVIVALLIHIGIWLGDFLGGMTKPNKKFIRFVKNREQSVVILLGIFEWIFKIVFWGFIIFALVYCINNISTDLGKASAQNKINFSSISAEGEDLQKLIIYKNSNEIILKIYSNSKKEFLGSYEVINGASYITRSVDI